MENHVCIDCGKDLGQHNKHTKKCRLCYYKSLKGKGNPNYKDGRASIKHCCLKCNIELNNTSLKTHLCQYCYLDTIKGENHPMYGTHRAKENNPNYKHGKTYNHKCCDCGVVISRGSFYQGSLRCKSCARKNYYKNPENHPNWQGGKSFELYSQEWTEKLRNHIRERDNKSCAKCGRKQETLVGWHKKLHVHHIDYNKQNCNPNNLISLCHICHATINKSKQKWILFFKKIIKEIYAI